MATALNIEKKIMGLPPKARREVIDFVEFLDAKYRKISEAGTEERQWKSMSAASLDKIWDNSEDDVYNELL